MVVALAGPEPVVGVALNRLHHKFTDRERERLTMLQPHLRQAYTRALHQTLADATRSAVDVAMKFECYAWVVLDRSLRVMAASDNAFADLGLQEIKHALPRLPKELRTWIKRTIEQTQSAKSLVRGMDRFSRILMNPLN